MDFLDPKKRKLHRIQLFIGYGLMAIALGFGSVILLYRSYGYNLDPITGDIVQNGLVFVDAHPEAAEITINGEKRGTTDQRFDMPAGEYSLELSRIGYRSWRRSFTLEGRSIERFVYPFLFPTELKTSESQAYTAKPGLLTGSPDRKWLLIQQPTSYTTFDLVDTSSQVASIRTLEIPATLLQPSGNTHSLELVEWSTDNRHVLLKHTFDTGFEYFLLDTESPGASVNITKTFAVPFTKITLRDKKFDQYYLHNDANMSLLSADLKSAAVTTLLSNVITFRPHGSDVLIYVSSENAPDGKVYVKIREGAVDYIVRELPANTSYVVEVARFENSWYFAAGAGADQKTYVYRNPVTAVKNLPQKRPVPVGILRLDGAPEQVVFSANARFIATQHGSQFSIYDAETDRQYRYDTKIKLSPGQKAFWMDGHRLTLVAEEKIIVFDYDGINLQHLSAAYNGTQPLFDRDYEAMFSLSPSTTISGRSALARTELVVKP